jgi:hypothetical protein
MRTPTQELKDLRVSLARVAQAAGVETKKLPVLNKAYEELCDLAEQDRGWNGLAARIVDRVLRQQDNLTS